MACLEGIAVRDHLSIRGAPERLTTRLLAKFAGILAICDFVVMAHASPLCSAVEIECPAEQWAI